MITIAVGDIHGCVEQLKNLWKEISKFNDEIKLTHEKLRVVFLGDYIDRGPDSKGVIDFLISLLHENSDIEFIFLKGNHEEMMLTHSEDYIFYYKETLASYHVTLDEYVSDKAFDWLSLGQLLFFKSLRSSFIDEDNKLFFCHAGIKQNKPLTEQVDYHLLWERVSGDYLNIGDYRVIHGHTPPHLEVYPHRINIDTGCVYGRALTAVVFKDSKLVNFIQVDGLATKNRNN